MRLAAATALAEAGGVVVVDVVEAVAMAMRVSAQTLMQHDSMHISSLITCCTFVQCLYLGP